MMIKNPFKIIKTQNEYGFPVEVMLYGTPKNTEMIKIGSTRKNNFFELLLGKGFDANLLCVYEPYKNRVYGQIFTKDKPEKMLVVNAEGDKIVAGYTGDNANNDFAKLQLYWNASIQAAQQSLGADKETAGKSVLTRAGVLIWNDFPQFKNK